jgi:folate-dependent phosphoribosylglycinamide formyltransferase PurN
MGDIVIFSPSRISLYTICVTELLRRNNVNIRAIVVRKMINPNRFFSEFNRDGNRLIRKIWKKIFLRKTAYKNRDYETIVDLMKKERIVFSKVEDFHRKHDIPTIYCDDLNDTVVVETLQQIQPDMVVFTGGGLIRTDVLDNSGAGVLNCHMGVLPRYRGMDVVEWAILEDAFDQVGMTVHFMDKGVDTGDIIQIKHIKIKPGESMKQLRERFEPVMCRQLVKACTGYLNGELKRRAQKIEEGKQYFIMHSQLKRLAEDKLASLHHQGTGQLN